jgi:hypothetical protein
MNGTHETYEPIKGRLYLIRDRDTGRPLRLSRATTQAGALARYSAHALDVSLPSQSELIAAARAGVPTDDDGQEAA